MSSTAPRPVLTHRDHPATGFVNALARADFARARQYLSDDGFSYLGPVRCFHDADAFIADISRIGTILKTIEQRHLFESDDAVCVICDVVTTLPDLEHTRVAMLFTVDGPRIRRLEVFYDAHPYVRMFQDLPFGDSDPHERP